MIDKVSITFTPSDEERKIVKYLCYGLTAPEIAVKINMNRRTVEHRILNLKRVLNCNTLAQLAAVFIWEGIITKPKTGSI